MFKIEKKSFGFKLTFSDSIKADEMKQWVDESKKALAFPPQNFGVFVDMRTLRPLTEDVQAIMQEGQKLFKQKGMKRSVVIVAKSSIKLQFKRIAKDTGIYEWERYIDASSEPNWEKVGIAWLNDGTDPDK